MRNVTMSKEELKKLFEETYKDAPQGLKPNSFNVFKSPKRECKLFLTETHVRIINEAIKKEWGKHKMLDRGSKWCLDNTGIVPFNRYNPQS